MEKIGIAIITAGAIGIVSWLLQRVKLALDRHIRNTKQLEVLPVLLETHKTEHEHINKQLLYSSEVDVIQLRNQLLLIHERAIEHGSIAPHWKSQFYDLYAKYKEGGGNGLVDNLKVDIDKM